MNRREVLLRAKTLCLDLIRLNQEQELLEQRKKMRRNCWLYLMNAWKKGMPIS